MGRDEVGGDEVGRDEVGRGEKRRVRDEGWYSRKGKERKSGIARASSSDLFKGGFERWAGGRCNLWV